MKLIGQDSFIIVIPVFNEEKCINTVIRDWIKLIHKYPFSEIIVVDCNSTDRTPKILSRLENNNRNLRHITIYERSHGAAIRAGYEHALSTTHRWIFQTDSDGQFKTTDFKFLWQLRNKNDFVFGFRHERHDPKIRLLITQILKFSIIILYGIKIKDANCPYRLINRKCLKKILKRIDRNYFAPNVFISILSRLHGYKVAEYRVVHLPRLAGKNSISGLKLLRSSYRSFKDLFRFFSINHRQYRIKSLGKILASISG